MNKDFSHVINAYVVPTISADRPCIQNVLKIPKHIHNRLADPNYNEHGDAQILLGGDIDALIQLDGFIKSSAENIIFRNSELGWLVSGAIKKRCFKTSLNCNIDMLSKLDTTFGQFWECEELPLNRQFTSEEISAENFYKDTTKRLQDGHTWLLYHLKANPFVLRT